MALASTPTLLSLDQFASLMGISPWGFNQLDVTQLNVETTCTVWFQHSYQSGRNLAREVLSRAIADAENMLAEHLRYWPAPKYTVNEDIPYPRGYPPEWWTYWYNERWKLKGVRTHYGRIVSMGIETLTPIDDDVALTYSDADGDTVNDWWTTGPIATTITDPGEIAVYVRDADRPDSIVGPEDIWRIRPVKVEIAGGNVTVSGSLALLLDPALTMGPAPTPQDPTDEDELTTTTFLTALKLCRRWTDTSTQGTVSLEHVECYGTACSLLEVNACFGERDAEMGIIIPEAEETNYPLGPPDCCSAGCYYAPDFCSIHYLSGSPLVVRGGLYLMDHLQAQMVARLAVCLLPDEACAECGETEINYWRMYPSQDHSTRPLTFDEIENPLGPRRGQLWVWRQIQQMSIRRQVGAIT